MGLTIMKEYGLWVEEFIVNGMMIKEIAVKYGTNRENVTKAISKYYGSGKYKLISTRKPASKQKLIKQYSNITNLKELYEREYRSS